MTSGYAILDTMKALEAPIVTFAVGHAESMAAILLASGEKGRRFCSPNARIMIHQPLGGAEGQAADIQIQAHEILRMKSQLNKILSKNTGQTIKKIEVDTDRDNFMTADQAKKYGIIDSIFTNRK